MVTPAAAPDVMYAASTPISSARCLPALSCRSERRMNDRLASAIASSTCGNMIDPPLAVPLLPQVLDVLTPSRSYSPIVLPGRTWQRCPERVHSLLRGGGNLRQPLPCHLRAVENGREHRTHQRIHLTVCSRVRNAH